MAPLHSRLRVAASLVALAFAITFSPSARADGLTVAGEAGPILVVNKTGNDVSRAWGFGAAGRIGYSIGVPLVSITPEAKLGYVAPGKPHSFLGMGGVRVNLFEVISPAIFAHAGGVVGDLNGFVWDAGLGLDLGVIPFLDICSYQIF